MPYSTGSCWSRCSTLFGDYGRVACSGDQTRDRTRCKVAVALMWRTRIPWQAHCYNSSISTVCELDNHVCVTQHSGYNYLAADGINRSSYLVLETWPTNNYSLDSSEPNITFLGCCSILPADESNFPARKGPIYTSVLSDNSWLILTSSECDRCELLEESTPYRFFDISFMYAI